ncbi:hypothetical protein Tco_0688657, partial [Tanacetum coccineum]
MLIVLSTSESKPIWKRVNNHTTNKNMSFLPEYVAGLYRTTKDTQENIHPGLPTDTMVLSPPNHDAVSEDVNEQIPNCNDGTVIVQERKEVEMTSDAKGKEIAEGSTSNEQENILQDQISEIVYGLPKGRERESLTTPPPSVPNPRGSPLPLSGGNVNNASGNLNSVGLLGGQLGGFRALNGNNNSVGHAFNLAGIGNGRGIGSFSTLCRMLTRNSHTGGFKAASTSTGRGNNTVGLYQGGNNENQDLVRSGDGTIDLLSRVGLGSGAYEEGNGDHGDDNETESQLM